VTAKDIRVKCEEDIKKLQEVCNHPKSTWCLECWAVGHTTGRSVLVCDICEKVLETKDR
jgi:transcription elongation factor Elf1